MAGARKKEQDRAHSAEPGRRQRERLGAVVGDAGGDGTGAAGGDTGGDAGGDARGDAEGDTGGDEGGRAGGGTGGPGEDEAAHVAGNLGSCARKGPPPTHEPWMNHDWFGISFCTSNQLISVTQSRAIESES